MSGCPNYYPELLDSARAMPIILVDTLLKRATLTNGEDMTLQVLMHRESLCLNTDSTHSSVKVIEGASPNRKEWSTRDAMRANADHIVAIRTQFNEPGTKKIYFKDEVNRVFTTLSSLQQCASPANKPQAANLLPHRLVGFEYMSLVRHIALKYELPRCVNLIDSVGDSYGGWYQCARAMGALVLFADDLPDILQPLAEPANTSPCQTCLAQPKGDYTLTVRAIDMETQIRYHRNDEHPSRLTEDGWTLLAREDPFRPCGTDCCRRKTVSLEKHPASGAAHFVPKFPENGAMVIGIEFGRFAKATHLLEKLVSKMWRPGSQQSHRPNSSWTELLWNRLRHRQNEHTRKESRAGDEKAKAVTIMGTKG